MTKAQLVNELIGLGNHTDTMQNAIEYMLELGADRNDFRLQHLQFAHKEMECGEQIVYVATSESGGKHKGTQLMRVEHAAQGDGPDEKILII